VSLSAAAYSNTVAGKVDDVVGDSGRAGVAASAAHEVAVDRDVEVDRTVPERSAGGFLWWCCCCRCEGNAANMDGTASGRKRTNDKLLRSKSSSRKCFEHRTADLDGVKSFQCSAVIHHWRCC